MTDRQNAGHEIDGTHYSNHYILVSDVFSMLSCLRSIFVLFYC